MSDKQLICDECGSTYSYKDHKTVYDCLSADCDGSLVPDENNQRQDEEMGGIGRPIAKGSVKITNGQEAEWIELGELNSGGAEYELYAMDDEEASGKTINFPSHELTAGEGVSYSPLTVHRCRVDCDVDGCDGMDAEDAPDLLERIKTATVCCGERMLVARVGQQNVQQMEVSFTCGECKTDMRFFVPRDESGVITFAEKLKQSQDQQPTMSNMLWT